MATVFAHYQHHLADFYEWMVGDVQAALLCSAVELDAAGLLSGHGAAAVDLGAGIGLHALPLAQRGYAVIAIDSNDHLLSTLQARAGSLAISAVHDDLLEFKKYLPQPAQAILCMGDTLTHLPTVDAVRELLATVAASLAQGGVFVATFRDYVTAPLIAERRFIPVRSDAQRILTCFLEYSDDIVMVHDLFLQWQNDGWVQRVSCYPKLRLKPQWLIDQLQQHGLSVRSSAGAGGMIYLHAART